MKPLPTDKFFSPERIGQFAASFFLLLAIGGTSPRLSASPHPQNEQADHQRKVVAAVRTTSPIKLDGDLSDAAWEEALPANQFVQAEPYEGKPATEKTDVKILYDKGNLYVGVYCHDSEPNRIVVTSLKEDFAPNDMDTFWIILDTFQDGRNGFLFVTNPQGAKRDAQISDEGRNNNENWDTVWDVRSQANGDGWTAEFVIPFKSLSFDQKRTEQVWGINFSRRIRRKNEVDYWSPIPRQYDIMRLSQAGELSGLEDIERGRNLKVKPFVASNVHQLAKWEGEWGSNLKPGVDAKYSVTPSLTLDLTANTDFSQVEVDEQQINLTRFPLFFPEKREFFLENDGIFQFGDLPVERGPNRAKETQLFFSRKIGLSDEGEPLPIWGGARLSGQIGKYSLGLLSMQTKEATNQPGYNFAVARVKRNILANSDIGAIFTNRAASLGKPNHRSWGTDANFRLLRYFTLNSYLAQTKNEGTKGDDWAGKIGAQWRDNHTRVQFIYTDVQANFKPEVGFTYRQNARYFRSRMDLFPRPRKNRYIRYFQPHVVYSYYMDQQNRTVTKEGHYGLFEVYFHSGTHIEFHYDTYFDRLDSRFEIRPKFFLPPGDYLYNQWVLESDTDPSKKLSGVFNFTRGEYYSGTITTVVSGLNLRPNYRFSVENQYTHNKLTLPVSPDEQKVFTTHLFRSRINYYFSTRMFLTALIQYNSDRKQLSSNIRFNFIHHPLSDLFLVYNEQRDVSGAGRTDRAISLKYTHMIAF